jgi:RTX calcium-binding nonapeptide repeat (4 copies)
MSRSLLVVFTTSVAALLMAPAAGAFTVQPVWKCRASAVYASISGNNRVEPIVANGNINTARGKDPDKAQCAPSEAGLGNTATQLGIPQNFIGVRTASAITTLDPELGMAIDQKAGASALVEDLTVQLQQGGPITLGVGLAKSSASGSCAKGSTKPVITGSSEVLNITLGGEKIELDRLVEAIAKALDPLKPIIEVIPNERIVGADGSLTVRALHVKVLQSRGNPPLLDLVVAESKVGVDGPVCDPDKQVPGDGTKVCPTGSQLDAKRGVCIIPATSGSSYGEIIVGKPFEGPSGGTVVPLDIARRLYGRSPCLSGGGRPLFAVIGTNKADRITGTNIADRIIGLGGNDKLDGGRGNDCVEGRTGSDNISGGLNNDKLYGASGKDHLNGGPGTDYMSAGAGNDTVNAAFGRDRALGGSGRDFINIATAGPPASANCGSGRDIVRINRNERKKIRACEKVYIFRDR